MEVGLEHHVAVLFNSLAYRGSLGPVVLVH
jgi:hypothetical protein